MKSETFDPMRLDELPLRRLRSSSNSMAPFGYKVAVLALNYDNMNVGYGDCGRTAWFNAGCPKQWAAYTCYPFAHFSLGMKGYVAKVRTEDEPKDWSHHYLFAPIGRSRSA